MTDRAADRLTLLCERRIGQPVSAATRIRVKTPDGRRTRVLALAGGHVWWLELSPWRARVGRILLYRSLDGLAAHTERRLGGRHVLELSWPAAGELFVGTLRGAGGDGLIGQLTSEQFARTTSRVSEPHDEP